jgi:hypothetical protein
VRVSSEARRGYLRVIYAYTERDEEINPLHLADARADSLYGFLMKIKFTPDRSISREVWISTLLP